jgi:hypothetical protein
MELAQKIQKIETTEELRTMREELLRDRSLVSLGPVTVHYWENEINDINARLENLEAAASIECES